MRLHEVSNQVKLAMNRELSDFLGHLMCKADKLRVQLNGTEGEETSGGDDNYQFSMSKHKENVARETMGNKDGQLRGIMAKVNIRRNAGLKEAMWKVIIKREVHKAWNEYQHIMRN